MKAYRGRRSTAPLILNFHLGGEWLTSRTGHFTPGKEPTEQEAGWAPESVSKS